MEISEALTRLGGVATRAQLVAASSRAAFDEALDAGTLERLSRGRYVGSGVGAARRAAHRLTGTVCLLSAALEYGWAVKTEPARPQVAVARSRKIAAAAAAGVDLRRLDLDADDVANGVTTQDRTVVDCARHLPSDEALAVLDSALRSGFSHARLVRLAEEVRGPGARRVRDLAGRADGRAANPFESALRDIGRGVAGLDLRPQVSLYADEFLGRPDLVDVDLRIVVEADSFEWHGGRGDLARDARRYNRMVVNGWLVLRFAWEDVMFDPDYVREVISAAVVLRSQRLAS